MSFIGINYIKVMNSKTHISGTVLKFIRSQKNRDQIDPTSNHDQ